MIDRRFFLQLLAGAAAGSITAGSGKWVYDSFSILHEENFVVPPGKESFVNSVCKLCHGGCGLKVRKIDERIVGMAGRPNHPINDGGICPIGLLSHIDLYHPLRLKKCMKRNGASWQEISWDQALSEIKGKIPSWEKSWLWIGEENSVTANRLVHRILSFQGSSHYYRPDFRDPFSYQPFEISHGIDRPPLLDYENTHTLFSFGDAFLEDFSAPPWVMRIYASKKPGRGILLYAGTGLSTTSQKADLSLQAKPGTQGFVALGIIYNILAEQRYDKKFISRHSEDFNEFKDFVLRKYNLEILSKITGVPVNMFIKATQLFLERPPSVAIAGSDIAREMNGPWSQNMVHALNILVGSVNAPGGIGVQEPLPLAELKPVLKKSTAPLYPKAFPYGNLNRLKEAGVVFIDNANLMYHAPQPQLIQEWLNEVPLVVAFATHRLPSFEKAHYLLPVNHFLEGFSDAGPPAWFPHFCLSVSQGTKAPHGESRDLGDVVLEIARSVIPDGKMQFPWKKTEEVSRELYSGLMSVAGMMYGSGEEKLWYETLRTSGLWTPSYKNQEQFFGNLVKSGGWFKKITLPQSWDKVFSKPRKGYRFQPLLKPEKPTWIDEETEFPLILQPLSVHHAQQCSKHLPYLGLLNFPDRDAQNAIPVILSHQDAHHFRLMDRDSAILVTEGGGQVEVLVFIGEDVPEGVAQVIFGLSSQNNPNQILKVTQDESPTRLVSQRCRLERL